MGISDAQIGIPRAEKAAGFTPESLLATSLAVREFDAGPLKDALGTPAVGM